MNEKIPFLKSVCKFILVSILVSLFLTGCDDDEEDPVAEAKIEKHNNYTPSCVFANYSAKCSEGEPACGNKPREFQQKVHCIDKNDVILSNGTAFCEHTTTKQPGQEGPICSSPRGERQDIESEPEQPVDSSG